MPGVYNKIQLIQVQNYLGNNDNQGAELYDYDLKMKLIRSHISRQLNTEFDRNITLSCNVINSSRVHTIVNHQRPEIHSNSE